MYSLYERTPDATQLRLKFKEHIKLAGCNWGIIPNLLADKLKPTDNPPIGWTLDVSEYYNKNNESIIIDITPKNKTAEVFLCELDKVIGFTYDAWTPIMYRLNILFNGIQSNGIDKISFVYLDKTEAIYTMLYLYGSFKNGELVGTWNYPGPSPTNALLLWSESLTFFTQQVSFFDRDFLKENIKTI
ncbi:MAG: hypothetical protein IPO27_11430 [Bacteroidetes bacterium]|nr:hypothetical protein [Bacteroidota bacterium]